MSKSICLGFLGLLLTSCADATIDTPVHDPADRMFLDLVSIAGRRTLPTQSDTTLLIKAMDEIKTGDDACAKWKLDQILTIGMPLVMEAMTADADGQQQVKIEARRKLREASALTTPADLCHGHSFPPANFS